MAFRSRIWPWALVPAFTAAAIAAVQCHVWSTQDATPNNRRSKMVNRHYDVPSSEPWLSEFDAIRERALKGDAEAQRSMHGVLLPRSGLFLSAKKYVSWLQADVSRCQTRAFRFDSRAYSLSTVGKASL